MSDVFSRNMDDERGNRIISKNTKVIDKGNFKIIVDPIGKGLYDVLIHNKFHNITELYDENLTDKQVKQIVKEYDNKGGK